ncbi:MAG TPA: DUF4436 family protein [Pseudonocardiaceae bacterium]|jgi:hypothetical protein|nr:DUF4436 family protein [Pseudonocardiaceae bacterium]
MRRALVPVLVVVAVAIGLFGYFSERSSRQTYYEAGSGASQNRVDLNVTVQRVDTTARDLLLRVTATVHGDLADQDNPLVPDQDLVVETTSLTTATLRFPAHERISLQEIRIGLQDGVASDYPFDSYTAVPGFYVEEAGAPVPVSTTVENADPFFTAELTGANSTPGEVTVSARVSRSRSTVILAVFMMCAMWAIALSVLIGALVIIRRRLGLVWPAFGWMAASLFALVSFRNAAPGSPPIGSLLDYVAFFWPEAIITVSLVAVIVAGARQKAVSPSTTATAPRTPPG